MKNFKISTSFNCVVDFNNETLFIDKNSYVLLSANFGEIVKVYPTEKQNNVVSLPYCFILSSESENCVDFNDYYEILLQEKLIGIPHNVLQHKNGTVASADFFCYPHILSVDYDNRIHNQSLSGKYTLYELEITSEVVKLYASGDGGEVLVLFHFQSKEFSVVYGDSITVDKNKVSTLKILNNIAKHAQKIDYKFDRNKLEVTESELYYTKNQPQYTIIEKVIPIAFLQALQVSDYNLARHYCTMELKSRLSDNHLLKFFSTFSQIRMLENNKYATINKNKATIYDFEIDNGQIKNIYSK